MWLRRFSFALALAGLVLGQLAARSTAAEPDKNKPAKDDLPKEEAADKEALKPFFKIEAALPPAEWDVQQRGLPAWTQLPAGLFTFPWPRTPGMEIPSMAGGGSGTPDLTIQPSYPVYNLSAMYQLWQQQQQYRMQVYQNWRNSRQTTGGILLPGMGSTSQGDACNPIAHIAMLYAPLYLGRKPGGPGFVPSQCFAAGTLVYALSNNQLEPIEAIRVGQRVLGEAAGTDIAPLAWRRVELRATRQDGSFTQVVLLRPLEWLEEQGAAVGSTVRLAIPGCGFSGTAEVLSIQPCPAIQPGKGAVVTGTFRHEAARVANLFVTGLAQPIGTTRNHRFWSEDRQEFVRADELRPGERLHGLNGSYQFIRLETRPVAEPVFNLEVKGSGVFHVSPLGLTVRDAGSAASR